MNQILGHQTDRQTRGRPKTKSSGLNQEPTKKKVPGTGTGFADFWISWLRFRFLLFQILTFPGSAKNYRPYSWYKPRSSWFCQEVIGFSQEVTSFCEEITVLARKSLASQVFMKYL